MSAVEDETERAQRQNKETRALLHTEQRQTETELRLDLCFRKPDLERCLRREAVLKEGWLEGMAKIQPPLFLTLKGHLQIQVFPRRKGCGPRKEVQGATSKAEVVGHRSSMLIRARFCPFNSSVSWEDCAQGGLS